MEQTNLTGRITKNTSLDSPRRTKSLTRTPELQEMSQLMAAPPPSARKSASRPSEPKPGKQKLHAAASPEPTLDAPSPPKKSWKHFICRTGGGATAGSLSSSAIDSEEQTLAY